MSQDGLYVLAVLIALLIIWLVYKSGGLGGLGLSGKDTYVGGTWLLAAGDKYDHCNTKPDNGDPREPYPGVHNCNYV